jgi:hypothetical protein
VAIGVLAAGSLAFGWWALGCASVGWQCAVGFVAIAQEYAVGLVTSAQQVGPSASGWLKSEWFAEFQGAIVGQWYRWVAFCVVMAVVLGLWKKRELEIK